MEQVYQENESKQTLLRDTAEITDSNESKYLLRARREQEGAFSHQTNKHKHRYTHTFCPVLAPLLEDLIKRRSAFVCPPLGSDFTNLPSQLHCPALHTHTQISRHKSKHTFAPQCVLCLQVSKSRRKQTTATLLIYCQLSAQTRKKRVTEEQYCLLSFHFNPHVNSSPQIHSVCLMRNGLN